MIKDVKFITSVENSTKFYQTNKPLIAVCGKSNVGKSSIINMLSGNKKLARTSVTPGRTRLINYFDFGDFVMADLPGYGYAKVSKEEKEKWGLMMEDFFATQKIKLVISLVDGRHDPTADDLSMINYLYHYALPFVIVATKTDKLAKTKVKPQMQSLATSLKVGISDIIASSSETGLGKNEIIAVINKSIKV